VKRIGNEGKSRRPYTSMQLILNQTHKIDEIGKRSKNQQCVK
jgi:hypothetical protein